MILKVVDALKLFNRSPAQWLDGDPVIIYYVVCFEDVN